jgi:hypothetical protein
VGELVESAKMRPMALRFALFGTSSLALLAACHHGGTDGTDGSGGNGGSLPAPIVTTLMPNQPPLPGFDKCEVTITDNVRFEGHTHEPVCTVIDYVSNPPSSGNHWPVWAAFKSYDKPVPREMYVHDLEHGAVVMLFNCGTACPDVVAALEKTRSDFGIDPLCVMTDSAGPAARIVISPDPKLATPIALTAWQSTYVATCIDAPSLLEFTQKHYGHGTETLCNDGKDPADDASGVPACMATF